jgi:hypothetical protein
VNLSGASSQKLFVCETTDAWVAVGVSQASTNLPNNFTAVSDPTINDDAEYAVGSRWLNTFEDTQFVAVSVDSGTARWFRTDIGNSRFSGSRYGSVLDLNYYNVAGPSTSDLATEINFWTNSYASPSNTTSDATIARAAGDNGTLSVTNRGAGAITLFSGGAVSVATGTNSNFTIDPNGTGIAIVNSVGLKTIHTTPSEATHWIGRSEDHGIAFDSTVSYNPILQSADDIYILTDTNNNGGNDNVYFRSNALSGGASIQFAHLGTGGSEIKPDGTNGVSMTGAGLLAKAGTGSIVADKASNNGALTIETTASDGDIKLTPHGSGQVIVYGDTPTGQVGASGTMVITDDDTTSVQLALTSNLAGTDTPSTLNMLKRNGTTSTVAGEQLSRITSYGYKNVGTAANKIAGTIGFDANEAFNDSQAGSNFVLGLTGDGANTLETRFKILGDGTSEWTTNGSVGVQMDANGYLKSEGAGRIYASDVDATEGLTVGAGGYVGLNPNFGLQWPSTGTSVSLSTANDFLVLLDNNNNANADEFVIYDGGQTPGSADGYGNTAEEIFSIGHVAGMTIRPDKTNGVTMTSAGVLSRLNAGSIVADKVSKATAVTIETTAGDSSITLNTHGDGPILNYGITQIEVDYLTQSNTPLVLQQNNAAAGGATTLQLRKRHPTNAQGDNEPIGAIRFYGTRDTLGTVGESAGIWTQAGEDWTDTAVGTDMLFRVTPNGSGPGTGNARFSLYSDGSSRWTKDDQTNGVEMTTAGVLQKKGTGAVQADRISFGTVSSDATACTTGEVKFNATYTYFCVDGSSASQKWKRIAMSGDTW